MLRWPGPIHQSKKTLLKSHFVRALGQLERLHRCLLELIKLELERQMSEEDVTSAQAMSPSLEEKGITAEDLESLVSALKRLERYWAEHIRYGL
jgi:hypothetical protein